VTTPGKFGDRLRALREEAGLTQAELGARLGINRATVSRYEKGEREPEQLTLKRIAQIFAVTLDYLLGLSTECHEPPPSYTAVLQCHIGGGEIEEAAITIPPDVELMLRREADRAGRPFAEYVVEVLKAQLTRKG